MIYPLSYNIFNRSTVDRLDAHKPFHIRLYFVCMCACAYVCVRRHLFQRTHKIFPIYFLQYLSIVKAQQQLSSSHSLDSCSHSAFTHSAQNSITAYHRMLFTIHFQYSINMIYVQSHRTRTRTHIRTHTFSEGDSLN